MMAVGGGSSAIRLFTRIELYKAAPTLKVLQRPRSTSTATTSTSLLAFDVAALTSLAAGGRPAPVSRECVQTPPPLLLRSASVQFRITRQCRRFSSSTTSQPGSKTLTSVCRDENIVHSTSSSSESELDENGQLKASKTMEINKVLYQVATDVTVEYCRGLPQVTVPLPSRRERCRFTLKPITNNVGDLVHMLKNEDRGIDRVVALTQDDTRIASSSTIENLLEEDFKLLINDKVYLVRTPKQSRITGEEAKGLSDIKTLVSQLYEALNVQEHTIQVEKNLNTQLEVLRQELLPLEEKKNHLDLIAQRKSDWMAWIGLGLMSVQFGILARLTWWEYSWDIMEPVTYFVTYGTAMAGYAYFVLTKQEYVLKDVKDRQHLLTLHKNAKKKGFDLERYNIIRTQISHLERDLFKIKYPLKLHKAKKSAVQPATAETEITKQATTDAKLAH